MTACQNCPKAFPLLYLILSEPFILFMHEAIISYYLCLIYWFTEKSICNHLPSPSRYLDIYHTPIIYIFLSLKYLYYGN
jgi:hypothetical protein